MGITNFWRNKFLSIATIIVIAVIIFIFNIILAIQYIGNQTLQAVSERVDIVIYLRDDIEYYEAQNIINALNKISGVKESKYTSKEEALHIVSKTHPETADFLRKFKLRNPLPPSISITTVSAEDHEKVITLMEQDNYKNLMQNYVTEGGSGENVILSSVAVNLKIFSKIVRQIIFWMVLVFILGGTLIIVNGIQLTIYNRRQEIHIMRLVGATPNFIRLPFIFEGILYAIFAVLLSFVILIVISRSINLEGTYLWDYYKNLNLYNIFIFEMLLTILLAIISSFSAVEQYIKGKLITN